MNCKERAIVFLVPVVLCGLLLAWAEARLPAKDSEAWTPSVDIAGPLSTAWEPAGFGGAGNFLSVHFDPTQRGVVYAASDVAGVLRSTENGDRWEVRSAGLGNYEVSSFAVDPFDGNILYAGVGAFITSTRAGIYVSRDAGLTWQHLAGTLANGITFRRFRTAAAIAPDPAQRGAILSGSRQKGLWRTTDGGVSWTQVYSAPVTSVPLTTLEDLVPDDPPPPYPAPVSVVVFSPAVSTTVYAGLDGAGVIKSAASGVAGSWEPANNGLPVSATVKHLSFGPGGVLYAALGTAGVYKSSDSGGLWEPANGSLPLTGQAWVSSMAAHPTNPNVAYLTLVTYDYPSVWKTMDGGGTWVAKGNLATDAANNPTRAWSTGPTLSWQVALDRNSPDRLFFVNFWGIYRSEDGGESWVEKIAGAQNTCVTSLFVDTDHPPGQLDTLYAAHMDAALLASANNGRTWTMAVPREDAAGLAGHYWRFASNRAGGTKYYYTTSDPWDRDYGQVLRSSDGVNWTVVFTRTRPAGAWMNGGMLGLAVDPSQPSTLYVSQDGGQVFRSDDNGQTWAPTAAQPGGSSFTYALTVDSADRVFAGTLRDGLWRSTDGGASWERVLGEQGTVLHVLPVPGAVYAGAGDGNLYRSKDGGRTWLRLTNFSPVDDGDGVGEQGAAVAVDPSDPNHLFFSRLDTWHQADGGPGIFESRDGGASWASLNAGLGLPKVNALAIGQDGALYAGTWCGGTWRRAGTAAPPGLSVYLPLVARSYGGGW